MATTRAGCAIKDCHKKAEKGKRYCAPCQQWMDRRAGHRSLNWNLENKARDAMGLQRLGSVQGGKHGTRSTTRSTV